VKDAENFARYLKEVSLRSLPEASLERVLLAGGQVFLDGVPVAADEGLLKMRLPQKMLRTSLLYVF